MVKKTIGFLIVMVGLILLLANFELLNFSETMAYFWPLAFMLIALVGMIERKKLHIFYLLIFIYGFGHLLVVLNLMDDNILKLVFWPLVLFMIGSSMFINYSYKSSKIANQKYYTAVFGGIEEKNNSKAFTKCEITTVFGSGKIDFTGIELKDDKGYIEVTSIFGGAELILPKKYNVSVNGVPIFGGCDNKLTEASSKSKKELIINYTVIFGGIELKN